MLKISKIVFNFLLLILISCSTKAEKKENNLFVSILPQKYFLQKISSDYFQIEVMVSPGQSPATYEPLPQQLTLLKNTKAFFTINVPFEKAWLSKISSINPKMKIIDTTQNIKLRQMDVASEIFESKDLNKVHSLEHHLSKKDPHIWLSPKLVKIQAQTILNTLHEFDPENSKEYHQKYNNFIVELDELYNYMLDKLKDLNSKQFLVFHPSWGYFADEFGLQQIPIEIEGKKPTSKELVTIIEFAKKNKIKVLFVQKQFSTKEAESIAKAISGKIIKIDPLAENYIENMKYITDIFSEEFNTK
ncbi:MAG: zinc ABC transporter substrate-binding protein [Candidatus Cloacimonetes bacterium]|nr:zinc ABC transporter substrate-binding protein [Candidatus Cloacimonadota bacterium]